VEGNVSIGGKTLDSKSIGSAELKPANVDDGKREGGVLLTPECFCESVTTACNDDFAGPLRDTEIRIERGHAMVEVEEIHPENDIRVTVDGATAANSEDWAV